MTRHLTEEELVLYRYREAPERPGADADTLDAAEIARHLRECDACRGEFEAIDRMLTMVDVAVPEPPPSYERDVWARIQDRLEPEPRAWWSWIWAPQAALAATVAVLLIVVFSSQMRLPGASKPGIASPSSGSESPSAAASASTTARETDSGSRNRVLLAAVDEHLQRAEFVLTELNNLNAQGRVDLSSEQRVAEDLVSDNRLYRRTAVDVGDRQTASLLDELERALLDVAHAPSSATPQQFEELRDRLDAQGVLFKVRVAGAGLRDRQMAAVLTPGPTGL